MIKMLNFLVIFCALFFNNLFSTEDNPIKDFKKVIINTFNIVQENKDNYKENPDLIFKIIDDCIIPNIDFNEMIIWIVGKRTWDKSTNIEKKNFIREFKKLITKGYANILVNYCKNSKIYFLEDDVNLDGRKRIQISSRIEQNGKYININYRLILHNNKLFLYDLIIDGISFIKGLKGQLSDEIKDKGIQTVTKKMKYYNEQLKNVE